MTTEVLYNTYTITLPTMDETNTFIGKTRRVGTSLMVTIPMRNAEYEGLREGDYIKLSIKKVTKDHDEEE